MVSKKKNIIAQLPLKQLEYGFFFFFWGCDNVNELWSHQSSINGINKINKPTMFNPFVFGPVPSNLLVLCKNRSKNGPEI